MSLGSPFHSKAAPSTAPVPVDVNPPGANVSHSPTATMKQPVPSNKRAIENHVSNTIAIPQIVRRVAEYCQNLLFQGTHMMFFNVRIRALVKNDTFSSNCMDICDMKKNNRSHKLYHFALAHIQVLSAELSAIGYGFINGGVCSGNSITIHPPVKEWLTIESSLTGNSRRKVELASSFNTFMHIPAPISVAPDHGSGHTSSPVTPLCAPHTEMMRIQKDSVWTEARTPVPIHGLDESAANAGITKPKTAAASPAAPTRLPTVIENPRDRRFRVRDCKSTQGIVRGKIEQRVSGAQNTPICRPERFAAVKAPPLARVASSQAAAALRASTPVAAAALAAAAADRAEAAIRAAAAAQAAAQGLAKHTAPIQDESVAHSKLPPHIQVKIEQRIDLPYE